LKKITLLILVITSFLTSGCFLKEKDLGQMLFPISLGLTYENNKYKIYLQVLDTSTLSIVETESSKSETTFVLIHAEDENLNEAISKIGLQALTYISAIKLKSIVLHKSIFEDAPIDYHTIMKHFINTPLFRTKVQLFVTEDKLDDFYSVQYMLVGASVFSHTNEEEPQIIRGYSNPSFLLNSLKSFSEDNRMYHYPIMTVTEDTIDSGDQSGETKKVKSYKYDGVCFSTYSKEKTFECLNKEEAMGYRWYSEVEFVNVKFGTQENPVNIIIDKTKWKNSIINNKFEINVKLEGLISFNLSNYSIEKIIEETNNKVKEDIIKTLEIALNKNIDIYHLNDYAFRKNKDLKYNLNNVIINVDTNISNTTYYKY